MKEHANRYLYFQKFLNDFSYTSVEDYGITLADEQFFYLDDYFILIFSWR